MFSISFTISGLVFNILLMIVYFSKKRIDMLENRFYSGLIITSFFNAIIEIISFIFVQIGKDSTSIEYLLTIKIMFIFFLIWVSLLMLYFFAIGIRYNKKNNDIILNIFPFIIFINIIIILLPISINETNGLLIPVGLCVNAMYSLATLYIILMLFSLIKNRKYNKRKEYIPLYLILGLFILCVIIQKLIPDLFLINAIFNFITFVMYFTIENPDVAMLEQLNIAKEQADRANRAKTDFLSSMSHEIRTPLNAIVGFSNTLNDDPKLPEELKDEVNDILVASDNLLEIVNGVLDISKIEANKIEIIKKEYDTKKMFDELSKLTKARIGEKPIEFNVKIDESIPRVLYGDSVRVKQIILNLLTNAAKYTDSGKITFTVNSVKKDNIIRLIISVEDTGHGIKEENINKLFTKFERLEEDRNTTIEGTGLGLAITKKLVDMMNGNIVVQSKYGKGSKFTVSIDQGLVENPNIKLDETTVIMESMDLTGKKILLVDDNKLNIKVAMKLLSAYKPDITSLLSGEETLDLLKKDNNFDLILLDDMMPKLSGLETLKKIKEDNLYSGPVVVLTANALTGEKEKYLESGFDDYLAKPIENIELNRVLKKYLKK